MQANQKDNKFISLVTGNKLVCLVIGPEFFAYFLK